jgi:hypothetical protein
VCPAVLSYSSSARACVIHWLCSLARAVPGNTRECHRAWGPSKGGSAGFVQNSVRGPSWAVWGFRSMFARRFPPPPKPCLLAEAVYKFRCRAQGGLRMPFGKGPAYLPGRSSPQSSSMSATLSPCRQAEDGIKFETLKSRDVRVTTPSEGGCSALALVGCFQGSLPGDVCPWAASTCKSCPWKSCNANWDPRKGGPNLPLRNLQGQTLAFEAPQEQTTPRHRPLADSARQSASHGPPEYGRHEG